MFRVISTANVAVIIYGIKSKGYIVQWLGWTSKSLSDNEVHSNAERIEKNKKVHAYKTANSNRTTLSLRAIFVNIKFIEK